MSLRKLAVLSELPRWYEPPPFIRTGYRRPGSFSSALKSIAEWHNETLNIHSHLWPGIYWLYMAYSGFKTNPWLLTNGFLCAGIMGVFSALSHTIHIVSPEYYYVSKRLDYIGIVAVNFAHQQLDTHIISFMIYKSPCLFYVASAIELCFVIACVIHISTVPYAGKFWAIGYPILSSVPLTAITVANSHLSKNIENASMYSLGCSVLVILAGGIFYIGKFPERCYARDATFDYCNSHFWFHIVVVASVISAFAAAPYLGGAEGGGAIPIAFI